MDDRAYLVRSSRARHRVSTARSRDANAELVMGATISLLGSIWLFVESPLYVPGLPLFYRGTPQWRSGNAPVHTFNEPRNHPRPIACRPARVPLAGVDFHRPAVRSSRCARYFWFILVG